MKVENSCSPPSYRWAWSLFRVAALLRRGLIVRAMRSYKLPEWIRVSVGTMDQNRRFVAELQHLNSEGLLEKRTHQTAGA